VGLIYLLNTSHLSAWSLYSTRTLLGKNYLK